MHCIRTFSGGGGRIRTIEAKRSRFTVCPLWPLGNSPRYAVVSLRLGYYSTDSGFVKGEMKVFLRNEILLAPSEVMAVAIVKYLLCKSEVKCAHTLAEQTSLRGNFTVRSTTSRAARRT